jgi:hypothetical protein
MKNWLRTTFTSTAEADIKKEEFVAEAQRHYG